MSFSDFLIIHLLLWMNMELQGGGQTEGNPICFYIQLFFHFVLCIYINVTFRNEIATCRPEYGRKETLWRPPSSPPPRLRGASSGSGWSPRGGGLRLQAASPRHSSRSTRHGSLIVAVKRTLGIKRRSRHENKKLYFIFYTLLSWRKYSKFQSNSLDPSSTRYFNYRTV